MATGRFPLFLFLSVVAGCGPSGPQAPAGAPAGMPAMPVDVVTLTERPVDVVGEFVGTVKSRRSTTIQPQVDGMLTNIAVKSGDRVEAGALLFAIDAATQQAAVAGLESTRTAREADAALARQNADRAKALIDVGAISRQEYDHATTAQKTAEAQVGTVSEQIRQARTELGYYRVVAPTAGVVGDIPVRQGDRVTRSTALTTVDDTGALEVYVGIPVHQAPQLRAGLALRLLGDGGEVLGTERVSFVAPSVDDATQTVLVKAPITAGGGRFRTDQFVRAQIVFASAPGLTVPVVSVSRINGQYFAFVVEKTATGTVARQKAVGVGAVVGNDYVVTSGLAGGDTLIVSGIQKIGDGAPVAPRPAGGA